MKITKRTSRFVFVGLLTLNSSKSAEVLSALVWFNGNHAEDVSRAKVHKRIQELSKSENIWIATAAQSALENK